MPPFSCDISWVEKVWANLGTRIYSRGRKYAKKAELIRVLHDVWERLVGDVNYRRRLIAEGEAACRKIIDNERYRIHW